MTKLVAIVAARNEADRIGASVDGLREAFPGVEVWVGDDASGDGTAEVALAHGARVVSRGRPHGKGGNVTAAAEAALFGDGHPDLLLVCDGDLGASAGRLRELVEAVEAGGCDLAIAAFRHRVGGGFGIALRFARWAIHSRCGYRAGAPISGQRAMRGEVIDAVLPFAPGYGMEIGMTIDAVRAGYRVAELELDLEHRATGRTFAGFLHRGRQLRDFARVWWSRRRRSG
ncbi:MAG TPA: glycosyltransferase family 2 protein [Solirubrobacterales bacterium]|nr:glycosyltransferase family 2 protein [Solirubrobacterales bacterium]